ncbi:hypothetical protein OESDEN_17588 [Oesophagostomum dentatum]|uniref:Peptidase M13 N-terminal domain-containing protein n=1 Tax=Oesophagostomum dentatum TaxID=61180 RepID=A0A0B1SFR1_OESDE|nr:hypothetical protein OESDEN_17588 [Oesophagostomum dentatum]
MTIADLQRNYSFIDWAAYFKMVPDVAQGIVQKADFAVSVMEPDQYQRMNRDFATLDKTKLVNYLFMRLLLSNTEYLPTYASSFDGMPEESFALGKRRRPIRIRNTDTLADTQAGCAQSANDLMQFANGRVFVDYLYPDDDSKKQIHDTAGGLIGNVINSFQGMVDQLDWMTVDIKRKAYDKTAGIVQNIAYPDWIVNNTLLDEYYADLAFDAKDNYYDMCTKLTL